MYISGREILALSLMLCPEDTGTLRRSARVDDSNLSAMRPRNSLGQFMSGNPYVVVGYGYGFERNEKTGHLASEYAVPVHERLDQRHEPPTQAKFLEDAVYEYSANYGPTIGTMMAGLNSISGPSLLQAFIDWRTLVERRVAASGEQLL
jgi:hypothetical protein